MIRNNYCHGVWSDQGAGKNCIYRKNVIIDNEKSGIDFEIGRLTTGIVERNVFNNNNYGISFMTSGGVMVRNNLFMSSRDCDIHTRIWDRTKDVWDSLNVEIYQNIFLTSPQYLQLTPPCEDPLKMASRYMNQNIYHNANEKTAKFQVVYDSRTKTSMPLSIWQNTWKDSNGSDKADFDSVCVNGLEAKLDETDESIQLKFSVKPEILDALKVPLMVCSEDYGCAGPFHLKSGDNEFLLWQKV